MGYQDGFVVNVVHNGSIIEDKNGISAIPFNVEYSLRLKNKTKRKAIASIFIDGEKVTKAGDLIIGANETVEVERFIDRLSDGKKFRFVPLDRNDDKSDKSFGDIEVKFRLEKEKKVTINYPYYQPWRSPYWCDTITTGTNTWTSQPSTITNTSYSCSSGNITTKNCSNMTASNNISDVSDGKTVKGSYSDQSFNYGYVDSLESEETIISLKLVGFDAGINTTLPIKYCSECGQVVLVKDKFCGNCGNKINK